MDDHELRNGEPPGRLLQAARQVQTEAALLPDRHRPARNYLVARWLTRWDNATIRLRIGAAGLEAMPVS